MVTNTPRLPSRRLAELTALAVGTAVVLVQTAAGALEPTSSGDLYETCIAGAPRSADAHEAWSMRCHDRVALETKISECLDRAPTGADAREVWALHCRQIALADES